MAGFPGGGDGERQVKWEHERERFFIVIRQLVFRSHPPPFSCHATLNLPCEFSLDEEQLRSWHLWHTQAAQN